MAEALRDVAIGSLITGATRCRDLARRQRRPLQAALSQMLAARELTILSPVLDSLLRFYEAALGRRVRVGDTARTSDDESRLIGMLVANRVDRRCLDCSDRAANNFACALCSTRIMLQLAVGDREVAGR